MFIFQRDRSGLLSLEQRVLMQAGLSLSESHFSHVFCSTECLASLDASANAIPVGSVEFVRRWIDQKGLTRALQRSWPETYPSALYAHLGRTIWQSTLDEARIYARDRPVFIKPALLDDIKAFTGRVIHSGNLSKNDNIDDLPGTLMVWCSTPITLVAEYRAYIVRGQLAGIARYDSGSKRGTPEPDTQRIRSWVQDFPSAPAGYALDVGILPDGNMVLVEVNDGWALGYYPNMSPPEYHNLLAARWQEIVGLGDAHNERQRARAAS